MGEQPDSGDTEKKKSKPLKPSPVEFRTPLGYGSIGRRLPPQPTKRTVIDVGDDPQQETPHMTTEPDADEPEGPDVSDDESPTAPWNMPKMRGQRQRWHGDPNTIMNCRFVPGPLDTPCWQFQGEPNSNGYGALHFAGRLWKAHRLMWWLTHGVIPDGLQVNHRCDVKLCVNPTHLYVGTHAENMADMVSKGRQGAKQGIRCMNADKVREVRRLYATGEHRQRDLADQFDVGLDSISKIIRRRTWKHI
jgi:hypothetical protein